MSRKSKGGKRKFRAKHSGNRRRVMMIGTQGYELRVSSGNVVQGEIVVITCSGPVGYKYITLTDDCKLKISLDGKHVHNEEVESLPFSCNFDTSIQKPGSYKVSWEGIEEYFNIGPRVNIGVTLQRAGGAQAADKVLWPAIRNRTEAVSFSNYQDFIDHVFGCRTSPHDVDNLIKTAAGQTMEKYFGASVSGLPNDPPPIGDGNYGPHLTVHGPHAYALLKLATEVFLALESGVWIKEYGSWIPVGSRPNHSKILDTKQEETRLDETGVTWGGLVERLNIYLGRTTDAIGGLPYLQRIVGAFAATKINNHSEEVLPYCHGVLQHRFTEPSMIELLWSYWHEEGMLAQTMGAIALRFQNQRSGPYDPLGELEIDPLRPLNNILWGYIQNRHNRLTVRRRAFEYDHHYGLKLVGRAVPELRSADSRSKFLEAFHHLLYRAHVFHREDAETTVLADAFPLLNALKDVHLLLAEGAHNQYGDLPWTARGEMLTEQWMLARPEMREFLRGRHMVPYQEPWMGAVDAMKKLQGWTDTTITHFNELAVDGERLLLSIRFGNWSDLNLTEDSAKAWVRYWKPEIQRYLYGYLAVTGVDLMADTNDSRDAALRTLQPSALLQQRLSAQTRRPALGTRVAAGMALGASRSSRYLPGG